MLNFCLFCLWSVGDAHLDIKICNIPIFIPMASQLYGPAAKTGLNISGYVTEMIVFALETHHQYLFQTKKQKNKFTVVQ